MPSAADDIRAAIAAAGGDIPFEGFMSLALYGEHGFYATSGRAGRRGDFITSPEVGPLFGAVLARWIDVEWERLGRPADFTVVDAGAGPGTLARAVLAAAPACSSVMRYVAVETSAAQRAMHPEGVDSVAAMPTDLRDGVIIANELLDNLPFSLWVHDDGWREACCRSRARGALPARSRHPGHHRTGDDRPAGGRARAGRGAQPGPVPATVGDRRPGRRGRPRVARERRRTDPSGHEDAQPRERVRGASRSRRSGRVHRARVACGLRHRVRPQALSV
ncbi:MAG: hypothetical protein EBT97_07380 [Actinobacteria bacterium]|nr:hypothetical protein [Actinomycetota bacterium]